MSGTGGGGAAGWRLFGRKGDRRSAPQRIQTPQSTAAPAATRGWGGRCRGGRSLLLRRLRLLPSLSLSLAVPVSLDPVSRLFAGPSPRSNPSLSLSPPSARSPTRRRCSRSPPRKGQWGGARGREESLQQGKEWRGARTGGWHLRVRRTQGWERTSIAGPEQRPRQAPTRARSLSRLVFFFAFLPGQGALRPPEPPSRTRARARA